MEELYKSLLAGSDTLAEQLKGHLFGMTESDGPVLICVDNQYQYCANQPGRVSFLTQSEDLLPAICRQIDDGYDPYVCAVEGGCLIGTQLVTENTDCGYFMIFMPGYQCQTVQANMDLFELILSQTQLICYLIEKNNRIHHAQLSGMSQRSPVLCSH